jgi:hypothetical protein
VSQLRTENGRVLSSKRGTLEGGPVSADSRKFHRIVGGIKKSDNGRPASIIGGCGKSEAAAAGKCDLVRAAILESDIS